MREVKTKSTKKALEGPEMSVLIAVIQFNLYDINDYLHSENYRLNMI